jgi:hypothetical protein
MQELEIQQTLLLGVIFRLQAGEKMADKESPSSFGSLFSRREDFSYPSKLYEMSELGNAYKESSIKMEGSPSKNMEVKVIQGGLKVASD